MILPGGLINLSYLVVNNNPVISNTISTSGKYSKNTKVIRKILQSNNKIVKGQLTVQYETSNMSNMPGM